MNIERRAIILLGMILLTISSAYAQSYVESALLFSRTRPGGSARIQGMGGSQVALGGDYSSAYSNPAGLGMFNRSEFTITPAFSSFNTKANYLNQSDEVSKSKLNIPGISAIFHMPIDKAGFVSGSFAISMSRNNDFNRSTFYHGRNPDASIIDSFLDNASGATTAQFDQDSYNYNTPTGLAYQAFLIGPQSLLDPDNPNDEYFTDVTLSNNPNLAPAQQEDIKTSGNSNQWNFAYGINYKDKVFLGAGIGITSLRFKNTRLYSEVFPNDPVLSNLQLGETLDIKGNGINASIGAIVRPVDFIQVGLSFTTPTYYEITENYSADLTANWKNFDYYGDGSEILNEQEVFTDIVTSDYSLTTPMKLSTGIAFISKFGMITGDVEFTNPSRAKYSSNTTGVSFSNENQDIRQAYKPVINYRVGGEFRYEIFRVRAGYGVQSSTYSSNIDLDNSIQSITGGVGIRLKKFYTDFALVHSTGNTLYQPFAVYTVPQPIVDISNKMTTGMLTLGFIF